MAAGTIATLVWTWVDNLQPINSVTFSFSLAVFAFLAALLMVSNVRYYNPKNIDQRENQTCVIWKNWRLIANTQLYDISKDKMQENDVAAGFPEVVKKLQEEFDTYHAIGKPLIQEPVRFIIGDPRAPVQDLTSQDVYWIKDVSSGQAFGQGDCEKLKQSHGPYKVTIARDGK